MTQGGASGAPFGAFDTPTDGTRGLPARSRSPAGRSTTCRSRACAFSEILWTARRRGVQVYIGEAAFVDGARPDVAGIYQMHPQNTRAGWGYMLLTNLLPSLGNGIFKLYAFADDSDGHSTLLGTKTITCTNSKAVTPFGAIDTPVQGATVSGVVDNFGWTLGVGGHGSNPPNGGTVNVFIDGVPVGVPGAWTNRPDLSAAFPAAQYPELQPRWPSSRSTQPSSPTASIRFVGVTDSAGNVAGIGSRYFNVANFTGSLTAPVDSTASASITQEIGTALVGRRGFSLDEPFRTVPAPIGSGHHPE